MYKHIKNEFVAKFLNTKSAMFWKGICKEFNKCQCTCWKKAAFFVF